mgnify:CR=1 FL=1
MSLSYQIRDEKIFPEWRQHRDPELLILQGVFSGPISVDKITKFSVRPPELRHVIRTVGQYFRWFYIKKERLGRAILESVLDPSMDKSVWVDGLQNKVFLRVKAFLEILKFLQKSKGIRGYPLEKAPPY